MGNRRYNRTFEGEIIYVARFNRCCNSSLLGFCRYSTYSADKTQVTEQEIYDLLYQQALEVGRNAPERACRRFLKARHIGSAKTPRKSISKATRRKVYERFKGICQRCENWFSFEETSVDHIVSVNEGGINDISNYQLLCRQDNSSKRDNDWLEESKKTGKLYTEIMRNKGDDF